MTLLYKGIMTLDFNSQDFIETQIDKRLQKIINYLKYISPSDFNKLGISKVMQYESNL